LLTLFFSAFFRFLSCLCSHFLWIIELVEDNRLKQHQEVGNDPVDTNTSWNLERNVQGHQWRNQHHGLHGTCSRAFHWSRAVFHCNPGGQECCHTGKNWNQNHDVQSQGRCFTQVNTQEV